MTTVGPLGWIMAAAVAWGASGSGSAGGAAGGGVDCCAVAEDAIKAARAEARNAWESFMP